MNLTLTPIMRREIIAEARKLCEGGQGNVNWSYDSRSRIPVADTAEGKITVFITNDSILTNLRLDLLVRQETVRNGRKAVLRSRHGFGINSTDQSKAWEGMGDCLDLAVKQAQELWADFPEECITYHEEVE